MPKKNGPKKTIDPPIPSMKPQGRPGKMRTPQSAFDGAAGKDFYDPEKVIGERSSKGICQFNVRWAGFTAKHDTWEPLANLAGSEALIAQYRAELKEKNAAADKIFAAKKARLEAEAEAKREQQLAANRAIMAETAKNPESPVAAKECDEVEEPITMKKHMKRKARVWEVFDDTADGVPPDHARCNLKLCNGENCNAIIKWKDGTTGMWNHIMWNHPDQCVRVRSRLPQPPYNHQCRITHRTHP